jgi:hypothetical protein
MPPPRATIDLPSSLGAGARTQLEVNKTSQVYQSRLEAGLYHLDDWLRRRGILPDQWTFSLDHVHYMEGIPVPHLQSMGRWTTVRSLSSYIQESMAFLVWINMPEAQEEEIQDLCVQGARFIRSPPSAPWEALFARRLQWRSTRMTPKLFRP